MFDNKNINIRDKPKALTAEDLIRRFKLDSLAKDRQAIKTLNDGLTKTDTIIENFVNNIAIYCQDQEDGFITSWFFNEVPTLENKPYIEFDKDNLPKYINDLCYNRDNGKVYQFVNIEDEYKWQEIEDDYLRESLSIASQDVDTQDNKRNIYFELPNPPYDAGDIWYDGSNINRCRCSRNSGVFHETDWCLQKDFSDSCVLVETKAVLDEFKTEVKRDYATNTSLETTKNSITASVEATTTEIINMFNDYATIESVRKEIESVNINITSNTFNINALSEKYSSLASDLSVNEKKVANFELNLDEIEQQVSYFNDQSQSIAKLTTSIEGIEAQIGSITNITVSANGIGNVTLKDVLTSELLYLQIYPTSEDLGYLNVSPITYLSNNTKLTSRDLLFLKDPKNVFNGKLENGSIDKDGQNGVSPELDTTTYIELKEKLYSINDVADEHDIVTGKGIRRIGEYVFTGDENFTTYSGTFYFYVDFPVSKTILNGYCNEYKVVNPISSGSQLVDNYTMAFYHNGSRIYIKDDRFTSSELKEFLKQQYDDGTPVKLFYVLETPEEFTTEPVNIQLRKGYNRIEINDKNGLLNKTKLSYLADTEKTVEGTNSIIIEDAEPVNARSLIVYGNSFQETGSGKNKFDINDVAEVHPNSNHLDYKIEGNKVTLTAIGASGAQYIVYYISDLDDKERYIVSYKTKKVVKGTDGSPNNKLLVYGSNDNISFVNIKTSIVTSPVENEEYKLDVSFTGYKYYKLSLYNNGDRSVTIGETTEYYDIQFEPGNEATVYESYLKKPSPEFPSEIECVEGNLQLVDIGKNILNIEVKEYKMVKSSSRTLNIYFDDTILKPGNYAISIPDLVLENSNYGLGLQLVGANGVLLADKKAIIKIEEEKIYNRLYLYINNNDNDNATATFSKIQLEESEEATDYEPYIPNKVRNTEKFAIEKSTYTIDLTGATDVYLFFYDENDNLISKSGYHKLPYTFNNIDAKYVRFMFKDVNNDNLDVNDITDIQINDKFSLYGKDVDVNVGVKYDDDSEEYIELGKYTIDKPNDEETVNLGEYKGYDYLDKLNDNYVCTIEDFTSATVSDVLQDLCNQCGLEIDNLEFENNDFPVNGNIFENYKCKDVLSDILELACSIGIISKDSNKLVFRKLSKESSVTLTKNDYSLLTKNQIYGPVNSFSIKESQIEGENVTIQDDESIKNNGETEFSIVDNIFLYTPELRQLVLDSIWNNVKGLTYYDCKIESYHGLPYLNAGDKITVEDDNGNYFDTYVLKHTFTYDGTFKSVIESPALTKQQTNIKSDVSLREKLNQTVINVYKDKKIIDALITENTEQGSKITQLELNTDDITARMEQNETSIQNTNDNLEHNYYQRTQVEEMVLNSASGVTNTFSEAGGNNILRNTDFSAKEVLEEGQEYEYWYGSAERLINSESANGYSIKIKKSNFYQEQNVANGNYTLSFYYKITNSLANVKVQINGQEYVLNSTYFTLFQTGIKNEDGTYKIEPINISDNHLKVEFITDIDDSIEIYDIMCNAGSVKLAYSQNANETRTDTVNIGKGITITSSTSDTKFVATPEIMGFKSVNGDKMITEFTNKGMTTKEAVVEDEAEIVGIIRQKVGNQIWDAVTGV